MQCLKPELDAVRRPESNGYEPGWLHQGALGFIRPRLSHPEARSRQTECWIRRETWWNKRLGTSQLSTTNQHTTLRRALTGTWRLSNTGTLTTVTWSSSTQRCQQRSAAAGSEASSPRPR